MELTNQRCPNSTALSSHTMVIPKQGIRSPSILFECQLCDGHPGRLRYHQLELQCDECPCLAFQGTSLPDCPKKLVQEALATLANPKECHTHLLFDHFFLAQILHPKHISIILESLFTAIPMWSNLSIGMFLSPYNMSGALLSAC